MSTGGNANSFARLLWFVKEEGPTNDTELLIGIYSSEAAARAAIERLRTKPGFANFPQGFQIHPRQLDSDSWTEGFVIQ